MESIMETLKNYAINHGIKYRAAWNRFKAGKIPSAFKDDFGKILIREDKPDRPLGVICYARVSSSQNKNNLESQAERIVKFANLSGLPVDMVVKEIGSGMNDNRIKLLKILSDVDVTHIVVEHKNRLTRFGFNYIEK
jgi:putative resolvase